MARQSTTVSPTFLTSIADSLTTLPEKPKDNYTLREAIAILENPIYTALERGYSHVDIAVMLHDHGIPISPASLKAYLPFKKRTRRTRKAETPAPAIEAGSTPIPASVEEQPIEAATAEEVAPKRRGRKPGTKTAAKSKATPRATASKGRGRKK